jgi:hypothetical protein
MLCQSQVKVTLRLTVSQSVSLDVEPHLGLMTRYLLLFDNYGLVVRVSLDSRPYFTLSDLRLPFSSPPTTRRVTVGEFEPASTRVSSRRQNQSQSQSQIYVNDRRFSRPVRLGIKHPSGAYD